MNYWFFNSFLTDLGHDVFKMWMDSQSINAKATIHEIMDHIKIRQSLGKPFTKKLKGYKDIWELVAKADNKQYRPLFCLGPNKGEIIFLIGATKTGDHRKTKFDPIHAPNTAEKRRKIALENRRHIGEYKRT
jgi:hypothetical protein